MKFASGTNCYTNEYLVTQVKFSSLLTDRKQTCVVFVACVSNSVREDIPL